MNDVLLTVSGNIPDDLEGQIARGERPLTDYVAMSQKFGADLIDFQKARQQTGTLGKIIEKIGGPKLLLAWACFLLRHQYKVIFTDGEQIGLPLAFFFKFLAGKKRPQHLMIVHILSVGKKMMLIDFFKLQNKIDIFLPYATRQKEFIEERWGVPDERVVFTPFMVDANFFRKDQVDGTDLPAILDQVKRPFICSVGLEFRDYPTLIEAVKDMDVNVVIAAASPWSKRSDTTENQEIPANVHISKFTQYQLRQVYAASAFLVMPLYDVEFQAGVTALLEGMAMEKAIVCTRTKGQTDVVIDGETGLYVPPADPAALKEAITRLLNDPACMERMGRAGRQRIENEMSLDCYIERLDVFVQQACKVFLAS